MAKNITLRMDEGILKQAKRVALDHDQSVSQWVANLIADAVRRDAGSAAARRRVLKALDKTFNLGGKPLTRDQIYDRRSGLR